MIILDIAKTGPVAFKIHVCSLYLHVEFELNTMKLNANRYQLVFRKKYTYLTEIS